MKCPDCATALTAASLGGFDKTMRCFSCGGFWTEPSSVNRITVSEVSKIVAVVPNKSMLKFGTGVCPVDATPLNRFVGESVPANVVVKRCTKCGYWWWPGDNLMRFKPAQEAKISYFKHWGIPSDLSALTLPVLVLALLAVGLGVGLVSLRNEQKVAIEAGAGVQQFSATYLGDGTELISFKSGQYLGTIEYGKTGEEGFQKAAVENRKDIYIVTLKGLEEGFEYTVRIAGQEYKFRTL